ncbi:MAG TPA: hypothetical protein DEA62_05170 [Coxiellaceae bacterium]|nr:hypothetical protein [Coxiellaceae bacterium]
MVEGSVSKVVQWTENFLGKEARVITNKAGDKIFINAENTKRISFDIKNPYPHENPHVHVKEFVDGKWRGSRVYPKDVNQW